MTEKRTVFISGTPYTVTISSEQEVLSAAYAAGGAIIGLWDKNRSGQSLAPADYVVECAEDADEEFLERVVRRRLHMPWIIAETERLVIREFTAEDAAHMIPEDAGPGDEILDVYKRQAMESSGVARENVVAVPASSANTAIRSMTFPPIPSTCFPRIGRQASEYFCLVRFLT